jgi:antitoxin (DNA-binding transcriptional repressor) of toxin-antitoxin stability system
MRQAGVREARQNLSTLLSFVQDGHEVLITDHGRPVARLVAPLPLAPRRFPSHAALRRAMPRLDPPISSALCGSPQPRVRRLPQQLGAGPVYLDGGALASLYAPDAWSSRLERRLVGRRDLTVSELSVTEVAAGFSLCSGALRGMAQAGSRLHGALLEDLEAGCCRRVEASPATHRAAQRLALSLGRQTDLRPTQALHLALAMTAGVGLVLTFDPQLASAALGAGLQVLPATEEP